MAKKATKKLKAGVIGYGPAFNMGRSHLSQMRDVSGFEPVVVCDLDPARLKAAEEEFPGVATYTSVDKMLKECDVDVLAVILPHNVHCSVTCKCLKAGKHVVVEKPMAMTVAECDKMIAAAKKSGAMLSVYHNRHWDSNILTIMKHLPKIGRPFRFEACVGSYRQPREWWRSYRKITGGTNFDWGAHFIEWMLQVMQYDMTEISGFQVDEVWKKTDTEDEVEAVVRFKGNAVASYTESFVAAANKPEIRICGTEGAILATKQQVEVIKVQKSGAKVSTMVPMIPRDAEGYYRNIGEHLYKGKKLVITAELGRRVIQVLDYACKSARQGKALKAKYS